MTTVANGVAMSGDSVYNLNFNLSGTQINSSIMSSQISQASTNNNSQNMRRLGVPIKKAGSMSV